MTPFSILDLAPIVEGGSASQAFRNTLDLAQHAERWGYHATGWRSTTTCRRWRARRRRSSSPTWPAGTSTIRVGAGGIMLPNHSPLVIAEQFGTLESLFPGRIDLGLGRAPGSDQVTAVALRRNLTIDSFPQDVLELMALLREPAPGQRVRAVPGAGLHVPIWILGIEPVRRAARSRAGLAIRVRVALRAGADDGGDRDLPEPGSSPRHDELARSPVPHARRQRRRGRHGPGSAAALHVAPADISRAPPRPARARAAAGRSGSFRRGAHAARARWSCSTCCRIGDRRLGRDRPARTVRVPGAAPTPTSSSSPRQIFDHTARLKVV